MGNSLSFQNLNSENDVNENNIKTINKDNLTDLVDEIAAEFILKQNLIDMIRFSDKSYYDNMIILTSSIIKKEMTDLNKAATISFLEGVNESCVPEIRLTRSRDGQTGQAFFTFEQPNALSSIKY